MPKAVNKYTVESYKAWAYSTNWRVSLPLSLSLSLSPWITPSGIRIRWEDLPIMFGQGGNEIILRAAIPTLLQKSWASVHLQKKSCSRLFKRRNRIFLRFSKDLRNLTAPRVIHVGTDPWLRIKPRIGALILSRKVHLRGKPKKSFIVKKGQYDEFSNNELSLLGKKKKKHIIYMCFFPTTKSIHC